MILFSLGSKPEAARNLLMMLNNIKSPACILSITSKTHIIMSERNCSDIDRDHLFCQSGAMGFSFSVFSLYNVYLSGNPNESIGDSSLLHPQD
ncbi:hypothetical protein OIU79_015712 [Salix purpurea]|uniref:Uncharacterized protein n=1 Tax=Salix purpurea TaxID=77065 RepID=A0A9Q0PD31_SALPP|nr:hypothetical protein OIU79_015712 [Salix purpurea]